MSRSDRASMRERMHELSAETFRERPVVDTVVIGKLAGRHIEGAEHDVEDREGRGKILLAAPFGGRVVPAMEDRTRDHVFERAEAPIEIGVDECRMGDCERPEDNEYIWRDAGEKHDHIGKHAPQKKIERVKARRGDPFKLLGGMVHGMILPKNRLAVKPAVTPIHDEVFADQKDDALREERKRSERAVAVLVKRDQTL